MGDRRARSRPRKPRGLGRKYCSAEHQCGGARSTGALIDLRPAVAFEDDAQVAAWVIVTSRRACCVKVTDRREEVNLAGRRMGTEAPEVLEDDHVASRHVVGMVRSRCDQDARGQALDRDQENEQPGDDSSSAHFSGRSVTGTRQV